LIPVIFSSVSSYQLQHIGLQSLVNWFIAHCKQSDITEMIKAGSHLAVNLNVFIKSL
jgi:hypothetical protein